MQPRNAWRAFIVVSRLGRGRGTWLSSRKTRSIRKSINGRPITTPATARPRTTPPTSLPSAPRPPTNGDGQVFRTADGRARLMIYGVAISTRSPTPTLDKYFNKPEVTYKRTKWPFFVVSGVRDGEIFYTAATFPSSSTASSIVIELRYPAKDKAKWDPIVPRISNSLRG